MLNAVRVLVVGSPGRRAESLRVLLRALDGIENVGHTESITTAWQTIVEFCPNVVLVDAGIAGTQGLALLAQIAAERPAIGRLALAGTGDQARAARAAGATSVLMTPTTLDRLATAIRETQQSICAAT